jgi:serine/threonine protein kinase
VIPRWDCSQAKICQRLAHGTFGVAWLAEQEQSGELTKVVFKESRTSSDKSRKAFIHEVWMMQHLQGPHLLKLLGICLPSESLLESSRNVEPDSPMNTKELLMVLEFAPKGDLSNCINRLKSRSLGLKIKLGLDLARGLLEIHSRGMKFIHRDVRSQNVFIFSLDESRVDDREFVHAKLADLGILTIACPTYKGELGNWQYMAPEAFNGAYTVGYSPSIDVYSFGIVLWEILVCKPPFQEFMEMGKHNLGRKKILEENYRPEMPEWMPDPLKLLIESCWSVDANARPSFSKIVDELYEILQIRHQFRDPRNFLEANRQEDI